MYSLSPFCCANCGTPLDLAGKSTFGVTCPVCQYSNSFSPTPGQTTLTRELLENQLDDLMAMARTSGLAAETIVQVLRDELEFAAELANHGRDMCVQIVDLGPRVREPVRRTGSDSSALLRGRVVGG